MVSLDSLRLWTLLFSSAAILPAATINLPVDGTMSGATWTAIKYADSEGTASFNAAQIGSGGNPGTYWQVAHTYGPRNLTASASIAVAHTTSAFTWNPSTQGELLNVSTAFDAKVIFDGASNAVGLGVILTQDGKVYSHFISAPGESTIWTNYSASGLGSANFGTLIEGSTVFPDFTTAGSLIRFGFFTANGTALGSITSSTTAIDNFALSVEVSSIPEPATAAVGAAFIALAAAGSRRRPQRTKRV